MCILPQNSKNEVAFFLEDDLYTNKYIKHSSLVREIEVLIHRTLKIVVFGTYNLIKHLVSMLYNGRMIS